jgi:hypothetical protein
MLTIDTHLPIDPPDQPSAPRRNDENEPPDSQVVELPPALCSPQQGKQRRPRYDWKAPECLTSDKLGQPQINYHIKPLEQYGYSNLAFFGSILSTILMPRLPSWSCTNIITAMNVKWWNQSQDPIEKCFEDLLKVSMSTCLQDLQCTPIGSSDSNVSI